MVRAILWFGVVWIGLSWFGGCQFDIYPSGLFCWRYPNASETTLISMGNCVIWIHKNSSYRHNKVQQTLYRFCGTYCKNGKIHFTCCMNYPLRKVAQNKYSKAIYSMIMAAKYDMIAAWLRMIADPILPSCRGSTKGPFLLRWINLNPSKDK